MRQSFLRRTTWIVAVLLAVGLITSAFPIKLRVEGAHVNPTLLGTPPSGGNVPVDIAVDPVRNRIYVANIGLPAPVAVINESDWSVVTTMLPAVDNGGEIALNHVTNCLYLSGTRITVFDTVTNSIHPTSSLTFPSDAIAVNVVTNRIYAVTSGGLAVINGQNHTLITTISMTIRTNPIIARTFVAVNPNTNRVYVADIDWDGGQSGVIVVNGATNTVITRIPITGPFWGLEVNPNTNRIYVARTGFTTAADNAVLAIDGSTNTVVGSTPVFADCFGNPCGGMRGLGVNTATNRIYQMGSIDRFSSGLHVIDGATGTTAFRLPLATSGIAVKANRSTDRVYVTNTDTNRILVVGDSGQPAPVSSGPTAPRCGQSNQIPMANAGPDQTVTCAPAAGVPVTLDGSGSSDPDGDPLTYTWTGPFGTLSGQIVRPSLPPGTHTIRLQVDDGKGGTATDDVVVTVVADTTAPTLSVSLSPGSLSPANGDLRPVSATLTPGDACTASPAVTLVSITGTDGFVFASDVQGAALGTADTAFSLKAAGTGATGTRRTYTVTYRATDSAGNSTDTSAQVTVLNTNPVASISGQTTVDCTSTSGATVTLGSVGSSDTDNDPLIFTWSGALSGTGPSISGTLSRGSHSITLRVEDGFGGSATRTVTVVIQDTTAPSLTLSVTPTTLWPPDHRMVPIAATVQVSDTCDGNPAIELVNPIASSEADSGLGDGDLPSDVQDAAYGTNDTTFLLRAERSWTGTGRTYTITYRVRDAAGNVTTRTALVTVPVGTTVTIDIKPGSFPNSFSCRVTQGVIPVAVLSTATFDATTIDTNSVRFGKTGIEGAVQRDAAGNAVRRLEDVNGDGRLDLVLHFRFNTTGFSCVDIPAGQSSVTLNGRLTGVTTNATPIGGQDSIRLTD